MLELEPKDPKRLFKGNALIRWLVDWCTGTKTRLDYVLALKIEDFLARALGEVGRG